MANNPARSAFVGRALLAAQPWVAMLTVEHSTLCLNLGGQCPPYLMALQERSAGYIIYRVRAGDGSRLDRIEYLLLDYGRHWDFAKGHVEPGEDDHQAARRELAEETGITEIQEVEGFAREITYFFRHKNRGLIRKTVIFFLAEVRNDVTIALSPEHKAFLFAPFVAAMKRVTFPTARQVLNAAHAYLAE